MANSVLMPQQKPGMLSQLLPIAGTIVGGYYGGPAGAAAGGAVGGAVGQNMQKGNGNTASGMNVPQSSPMQRKASAMDADPGENIARANIALAQAPKSVQDEYGPQLQEAMRLQQMRQQSAGRTYG